MQTKDKFIEKFNDYSASKKDTDRKSTVNNANTVTNEKANTATVAAEQCANNANPKVVTTRSGRTVIRPQYYQDV